MKYNLMVRPEVDDDLSQAEKWYDEQQPGLGREFVRAVRTAMARIRRSPLIFRVRYRRKQVRWAYPRRFPYRVVFRVAETTIVVYAIIHAARHDRQWKRRL